MKSIRTKAILLNVIAITIAVAATTAISSYSIYKLGHENNEQTLSLACEAGKNNLDYYFKSVEQSVNSVSSLVDASLDTINDEDFVAKFPSHIQEARTIFGESAKNANGVLTYYYRIDPSITDTTGEKGFWYTNLDGKGFIEHEVTDLSDDQYECVWFYTPKNTGKPVWLAPYETDNLGAIVVSYNAPVYRAEQFVGVVGIEISYHTLGEQIKNVKYQKTGFAYIVENEHGSIIYHPYIDILAMPEAERPSIPEGFLASIKSEEHHIVYTFEGVKKHAYWLRLGNDMSIVVAIPEADVMGTWNRLIIQIVIVALIILAIFIALTILYTRRLTKPLKELTAAAKKINEGDYSVRIEKKSDDEIGVLTTTFNELVDHLGNYISDLNSKAYNDDLTEVSNKNAFDLAVEDLNKRIKEEKAEFAIAFFDCDDLKTINDKFGHAKGNVYLKNSSILITRVFKNSTVYRLGGDEFAIILQGADYKNREKLRKEFLSKSGDITARAKVDYEKVRVSVGIAKYDPEVDMSVADVIVHADHLMYENKRERKRKTK